MISFVKLTIENRVSNERKERNERKFCELNHHLVQSSQIPNIIKQRNDYKLCW